jgi:hypothetical protein
VWLRRSCLTLQLSKRRRVTLKRISYKLFLIVVTALVLMGFSGTVGWAASASCQTKTEGKLECMEFTGSLPPYLKTICGTGGSQNTKWVDSACPRDNLLGVCDVPRTDNVKQGNYCYRMAQLPDKQRLEYCRMGCNSTFSVTSGGPSASVNTSVTTSGPVARTPGSAVPPVVGNPKITVSTGNPQYVMEKNTNRAGDDYKDLDLKTPDPALCAQTCMNEVKCKAWTYVKPGAQGDKAKCWLKDRVPPASPDDNCVSGVKGKGSSVTPTTTSTGSTSNPKYAMEQGIDRTGDDYKDFDLASDPALCADACMNEAKCKAWTYVKPGIVGSKAHCWLKNRVPPPLQDGNCVSGVKKK